MNRDFTRLRAEHIALHTDEVTDVEQALEHHVIHIFIIVGAQLIARNINLDAAFRVLHLSKRGLTHHAATHHAAGNTHLRQLVGSQRLFALSYIDDPCAILNILSDFCTKSIRRILCGRVRVDAHLAQFL